ncbi:outer membrane beta-barrel protein [uncultured Algibacter sp.]|uniref:outer membrane beta-barrel protein n=1 Tax=uncultured Algibacter sp. TaxID=298659 RepID=UPI002639B94F|nr:outer membrane beta-barrel protein [uncultured Algibacter sp.]
MKKIITLSMFFVATALFAQEEAKKLTISGSVDAYYQTNLSSTDKAIVPVLDDNDVPTGEFVPQSFGTSFANETGFALGMANIILSYEGEKSGVVADVVFGPRGDDAIGGYNLNQLYAYWNVSEGTTLTMGRFNTYLGYEVISPTGNFNYSTSYLFSNGPFSHVGLKADFTLGEDFSLMLAVMNPTDVNNNLVGGYALGAQLGYAGQFLNFYFDDNEVLGFEIDYTGGFDLSEDFFLGINGAYQTSDDAGFYGVALYPQLATCDSFSLGLRGELFGRHAKDGSDLPSVFAATLTGSYSLENLTIKPEVRLDSWSNAMPYFDSDLAATESLAAFTLAAIYSF